MVMLLVFFPVVMSHKNTFLIIYPPRSYFYVLWPTQSIKCMSYTLQLIQMEKEYRYFLKTYYNLQNKKNVYERDYDTYFAQKARNQYGVR